MHGTPDREINCMGGAMNLPIVCKYQYYYSYHGKPRARTQYALLLEYTGKKDCYYTVNIEENGKKARGLRGECEMEWFNADFRSVYVPMDQLPEKVARTVREEIALFEEVMRRTHTVISPHEIFPD